MQNNTIYEMEFTIMELRSDWVTSDKSRYKKHAVTG